MFVIIVVFVVIIVKILPCLLVVSRELRVDVHSEGRGAPLPRGKPRPLHQPTGLLGDGPTAGCSSSCSPKSVRATPGPSRAIPTTLGGGSGIPVHCSCPAPSAFLRCDRRKRRGRPGRHGVVRCRTTLGWHTFRHGTGRGWTRASSSPSSDSRREGSTGGCATVGTAAEPQFDLPVGGALVRVGVPQARASVRRLR